MSETTVFNEGDIIKWRGVKEVPIGTKLIGKDSFTLKTRAADGYWFEERGNPFDEDWLIVQLPAVPRPPDVKTREGLAQALFDLRHPGNTSGIEGSPWKDKWLAMADLVLKEFKHRGDLPFEVGTQIKIVGGPRAGETGTISEELDEDGDYYINGLGYVNKSLVERI